jgi:uncharacterized protein (TIGR02444 family)
MPTMSEPASQETPFWRFSLGFYALPGVAPACLDLQDEAGVDVNLLMYLLWSAARCRALAADEVRALDAKLAGWRDTAVVPLRTLRRALKAAAPLVASDAAERFRTRIKAVELEAERLQQEAMYALDGAVRFAKADTPAAAARANVAAYQAVASRPFPADAIETLLAAFGSFAGRAGERKTA